MRSSFRLSTCVVTSAFLISLGLSGAGSAADAVPPVAIRCQHAIAKAATAFAVSSLADLGRCTLVGLACVEKAPGDTACLAAAGDRCRRVLGKIARREDAVARTLRQRCAGLDPAVLADPSGLGFGAMAARCPAIGTDAGDGGAIGVCMARQLRCQAERLLVSALPRAGELLRVAGLSPSLRRELACVPDHGGSGIGADETGQAVTRCVRTLQRAATRFGERTLASLAGCARAALPCLGAAAGEATCLTPATAACTRSFARIARARRGLGATLRVACGETRLPFAELAASTGGNLEALADACAAVAVEDVDALPAHAVCLSRLYDCDVATIARTAIPRLDEMLALVGQAAGNPLCPVPEATATPTPPPTPTATVTGPTRTPRPGETATPTPSPTPTVSPTPTPRPTATPLCGNGIQEGDEECDGLDLDDWDCELLCDEVGAKPVLRCRADCRFDLNGCKGIDCEAP